MARYSQKYCIVTFLESVQIGFGFDMDTWPLHVTAAGVFAVELDSTLLSRIQDISKSLLPITTQAVEEAYWGKHSEYHVVKLYKNAEVTKLHTSILSALKSNNAKFNNPEFEGDGYIPHCTIQKHTRINKDDTVVLDNLAIVDMFVDGDYKKRKVIYVF